MDSRLGVQVGCGTWMCRGAGWIADLECGLDVGLGCVGVRVG